MTVLLHASRDILVTIIIVDVVRSVSICGSIYASANTMFLFVYSSSKWTWARNAHHESRPLTTTHS